VGLTRGWHLGVSSQILLLVGSLHADPNLAYYSKIFTRMQQKNTSGLLKIMWNQDPFKAKWSIIARAYTDIRDQVGKANASIEIFFSIVCPKMGIISADDYFARM